MNNSYEKPKVGQIVFRLNFGRNQNKIGLIKVTVVRVGRKFFYCSEKGSHITRQYKIDTWLETYICGSSDSKIYKSEQEWEDEKEINSICNLLSKTFKYGLNNHNILLKNLRKIKELIHFKTTGE